MTDVVELALRVKYEEVERADRALERLGQTSKKFEQSGERAGRGLSRGMTEAERGVTRTSASTGTLVTKLGGLAAAAGAGFGLMKAAKDTMAFADNIAEVSTLVDTATFDMDALGDEALNLSREFGQMPTSNVKGFYQAISAGASTAEEATAAMTAANKLAIGGVTSVETAIDGLTTVMNTYEGKAGSFTDISDAMFVAMRAGKTTIGELSSSVGKIAPLAEKAGVGFDELLSATAALTKGGVSTSEAMTGLRGIVAAVVKPTKEAQEMAHELGIEFSAAGLEAMGFAGFLEHLREKTGGSSEKLSMLFGGVEALTPVMALTGAAAGDFAEILGSMDEKAGETESALTKMMNSPGFQSQRIIASLTAGFIDLGRGIAETSVPALKLIADTIPKVFGVIERSVEFVARAYRDFRAALESSNAFPFEALRALGGALERVGAMLAPLAPFADEVAIALTALAATAAGLGAASAAIGAVSTALGLLAALSLNPVIGGIAAVATGAVLLYREWDRVSAWWSGLWDGVREDVDAFVSWWQGTTFADKAIEVGTAALDVARDAAEAFASWWRDTRLGEWALEVGARALEAARDLAERFAAWWSGVRLGEWALEIGTAALDRARGAADAFIGWWGRVDLKEQALEIGTAAIARARGVADAFVSWWQGTTLREKALDVKTAALDIAERASSAFVALWNNVSLVGWVLPITSDPLDVARRAAEAFVSWWRGTSLEQKVLDVVSAPLEIARRLADAFVTSWNASKLRALALEVDASALTRAESAVGAFVSEVSRAWDRLTDTVNDNRFAAGVLTIWRDLGRGVLRVVTDLGRGVAEALEVIPSAFAVVVADTAALVAEIVETWRDLSPTLTRVIGAAYDSVVGVIELAWVAIKNAVRTGWDLAHGVLKTGLRLLRGDFKGAWDAALETTEDFRENFVRSLNEIGPELLEVGKRLVMNLVDGIRAMRQDFVNAVKDLFSFGDDAEDAIEAQTPKVERAAERVPRAFADGVDREAPAIERSFESIAQKVSRQMEGVGQDAGEGVSVGLRRSTLDIERAAEEAADVIPETARDRLQTRSPSRVTAEIGRDAARGFAAGISEGRELIAAATAGMSDEIVEQITAVADAVLAESIALEQGADAARLYTLQAEGMTDAEARVALAFEKAEEAIADYNERQERANDLIAAAYGEVRYYSVALAEGADAARLYAIQAEGVTEEKARQVLAYQKAGEAIKDYYERQERAADIVRDAEQSYREHAIALTQGSDAARAYALEQEGLTREKAEYVVALERAKRMQEEFHGAIVDAIRDATSVREAFENLGDYLVSWLREQIATFAANQIMVLVGIDGIGAAESALAGFISRAKEKIASLLGGFASSAAAPAAAGSMDAAAAGAANSAAAGGAGAAAVPGLGAFVAAAAGIYAVGEALSGAFGDGKLKFYQEVVDKHIGEMLESIGPDLDQYFGTLDRSMTEQFRVLGVEVDGSVLAAFDTTIRSVNTNAASFGEALQQAIEQKTREAYVHAWEQLSPALRRIVADGIDFATSPIEDIAAAFTDLGIVATQLVPMMEAAGMHLGSLEGGIVSANLFAEEMGGVDIALERTAMFLREFVPASEQVGLATQLAKAQLDPFNAAMGLTGDAAIDTREELYEFVRAQNAGTEAGRANRIAALGVMEAVIALEAARRREKEMIDAVADATDTLGIAFDPLAPDALETSSALIDLAGGLDELRSRVAFIQQEFMTEAERSAATFANAQTKIASFNEVLVRSGQGAITTREQFMQVLGSLDLTTESGRRLYNGLTALAPAYDLVFDAQEAQRANIEAVADAAARLNIEFDPMSAGAGAAADALIELTGGLDEFTRKTNDYISNFYDEVEQDSLRLGAAAAQVKTVNDALVAAGFEAVTTREDFMRLVEGGLGPVTEATAPLYAMLLNTQDAFLGVFESGRTATEIIDTFPEHLRPALELMVRDAQEANGVIIESSAAGAQAVNGFGESMDGATESTQAATEAIREQFASLRDVLPAEMQGVFDDTFASVVWLRETFPPEIQGIFDQMLAGATGLGETLPPEIRGTFEQIVADAQGIRAVLPPELRGAFDDMLADAGVFAGALGGVGDQVAGAGAQVEGAGAQIEGFGNAAGGAGTAADGATGSVDGLGQGAGTLGDNAEASAARVVAGAQAMNDGFIAVSSMMDTTSVLIAGRVEEMSGAFTALQERLTTSAQAIAASAEDLGGTLRRSASEILAAGITLEGALGALARALEAASTSISATGAQMSASLAAFVSRMQESAQSVAAAGASIGAALAALAGALTQAAANLDATAAAMRASVAAMGTGILGSVEAMSAGARAAVEAMSGAVTGAFGAMRDAVSGAFNTMRDAATGAANAMREAVTGAFGAMRDAVSGSVSAMRDAVTSAFEGLGQSVRSTVDATAQAVRSAFDGLGQDVRRSIEATAQTVRSVFEEMGRTARASIETTARDVRGAFEEMGRSVRSAIETTARDVRSAFEQMATNVRSSVSAASGSARSGFEAIARSAQTLEANLSRSASNVSNASVSAANAINSFASSTRNAAGSLGSAASSATGPMGSLTNATYSLGNAAISAANQIRSAANSINASRSSVDGSHALGLGYVPFDGYVAELHRGEAVLTRSEAEAWRALGREFSDDARAPRAPAVSVSANVAPVVVPRATEGNAAALAAIREELRRAREETTRAREEAARAAAERAQLLEMLIAESAEQTRAIGRVDDSNDRLSRQLAGAFDG